MPAPGAVLAGRYRIIAPLGAGGCLVSHLTFRLHACAAADRPPRIVAGMTTRPHQ
jgi:hypothetical protein